MSPSKPKPPKLTTLYFAVIDGADPTVWPLFGKRFGDLVADARKAAKPHKVPKRLLELFNVDVKPLLIGPEKLLEEEHLDKIVGVIIDALPHASQAAMLDQKFDILKNLHLKQLEQSEKPLYQKFGYKVWFATDDAKSPEIARFVENVRFMLKASIKEKIKIEYDYVTNEGILTYLITQCLHDAYADLAEGPN